MDAIILAGGRIGGAFAQATGVTVKALLELDGRSLLHTTVAAVRGSGRVNRICVVGPRDAEPVARQAGSDLFCLDLGSGIGNLLGGIGALGATGRVLVAASDLPFLREVDVAELIDATPAAASLSCAIFTRREWDSVFPDARATFFRLRDGDFAGAAVFVVEAATLRRLEPLLHRVFKARKSPLAMTRLLGGGLTGRIVLGYVHRVLAPSTEQVRRRVQAMTGAPCAIVSGCSPRLKADVDDLEDWMSACSFAHSASATSDQDLSFGRL